MKYNLKSILFFLLIAMMHFSCDDREVVYAGEPVERVNTLEMSEMSDDHVIIISNQVQVKTIKSVALDGNSAEVKNITVNYRVLSDIGYLSKYSDKTDSTVTLTVDLSGYNLPANEIFKIEVEGAVDGKPEVKDTIIFYEQAIVALQLVETNGNYGIDLIGIGQDKSIQALPLDENNATMTDIAISYRVLDSGPGYLSTGEALSDSTITLTINLTGYVLPENGELEVILEGTVVERPEIKDTLYFVYNEMLNVSGGISVFVLYDTIPHFDFPDEPIYTTPVFATLIDSSGNPVPNEWIEFGSIIDSTTGPNTEVWVEFGSMNPEMRKTNDQGIANSTFQSTSKTGFGRIVASVLNSSFTVSSDTTILYVDSGEAISLEILPASPDNEIMVIGGGDQESAQIEVEVRDGNGNIVNQEYRVIFTITCPYPIDGPFCPGGDGDFTNDIKINGIIVDPLNPHVPTDTVTTVNGTATITLNSGNSPGSVQLRAELYAVDDDNYTNLIAFAEEIPITIVTGPPAFGVVGYAFTDADTIGGGLQVMPISCMLWDIWSNPVADCTNVWYFVDPPESSVIIGEAQTANPNPQTGNSYPGVAWTTMQWSSVQTFEFPEIYCQTYGIDQWENDIELIISSEDNAIDYQNPCVQCNLQIIPLSATVKDFCPDPTSLIVIVRGILSDAYNVPVSGGQIQMVIYDAIAFNFLEDLNQVPPAMATPTQISNDDGLVTWVIEFPTDNCYNTNPDDPDEFECATPLMNAFLFDPNGAASEDITITLIRSCGDQL